jgi:hypothetical protein
MFRLLEGSIALPSIFGRTVSWRNPYEKPDGADHG